MCVGALVGLKFVVLTLTLVVRLMDLAERLD
jgi:hypothetical protein